MPELVIDINYAPINDSKEFEKFLIVLKKNMDCYIQWTEELLDKLKRV